MNKQIGYIGTVHYSRRDRNGNCYLAMTVQRAGDGASVSGTVSGGESNCTYALRCMAEAEGMAYTYSVIEHPIREFNRMTKGWGYAGCTDEQIIPYMRAGFETVTVPA